MASKADPQKRREWVERLRRYQASGLTVAQFCVEEGVSVPSFYQWRRKLRDATAAEPRAKEPGAFQPLHVTLAASHPAAVVVRLPSGVVLEVADGAVDAVVGRLLAAEA